MFHLFYITIPKNKRKKQKLPEIKKIRYNTNINLRYLNTQQITWLTTHGVIFRPKHFIFVVYVCVRVQWE